MKNLLLIKNGTVVTLGEKNQIINNGAVLVEDKTIKKIGHVEEFKNFEKSVETINARGKLIMPGFINQHMHFYSTFARGIMPKEPAAQNFMEILEKLWWPLDNTLNEKDIYYSTIIPVIHGIKNGTTTFFDHHESQGVQSNIMDVIEGAVREAGARANLAMGVSDRYGRGKDGIKENIRFINKIQKHINLTKDDLITSMFGIHALMTVNDDTLTESTQAAKEMGVGFHIHCAEDISDQVINKDRYGKTVIQRMHDAGGLGNKTMAIHCIYLRDDEMDMLASTNTAVVHIPQSNMNNAVGVANILKMLSKKILVGLGTDGVSARMQDDVRVANYLHKLNCKDPRVFFCECCKILLENNAKISSRYFSKKIGILEEGSCADIILVDYDPPTPLIENTFFGHFLFGICEATVDTTIVNGQILMKDKKLLKLNEEKIFAESRKQAKKFWNRFYSI